jgi:hypothetical protein
MTRIQFCSVTGVLFLGVFTHPFWAAPPSAGMWANTSNLVGAPWVPQQQRCCTMDESHCSLGLTLYRSLDFGRYGEDPMSEATSIVLLPMLGSPGLPQPPGSRVIREQVLNISPRSPVEVRLAYGSKLRRRPGPVTENGFDLQAVKGNESDNAPSAFEPNGQRCLVPFTLNSVCSIGVSETLN